MALARVTTWNPGDTLTAAALNAEYNNLLNNPITLISPTTGAINFQTSVAHTNLTPSAITASSGFAGSVLVSSTAATPLTQWSTGATAGGVFIATTGTVPTWSTASQAGGVFIATTSGFPTWLAIGSSGQVLTVSTSGVASWAASAATGGTVKAGSVVTSSGDQIITTTAFTSINGTAITFTPTSTAARLLIAAAGSFSNGSTEPPACAFDVLLDAARLGGASGGLYSLQIQTSFPQAFSLSVLTSIVSTGSHTATLQGHMGGLGNLTVTKSDPKLSFSVVEVNTTG